MGGAVSHERGAPVCWERMQSIPDGTTCKRVQVSENSSLQATHAHSERKIAQPGRRCRCPRARNVDVRLPGKGNSNSPGARPVHLIITMIKSIRTSRLSKQNSLCPRAPNLSKPPRREPQQSPQILVEAKRGHVHSTRCIPTHQRDELLLLLYYSQA